LSAQVQITVQCNRCGECQRLLIDPWDAQSVDPIHMCADLGWEYHKDGTIVCLQCQHDPCSGCGEDFAKPGLCEDCRRVLGCNGAGGG